ncbi:hypothetical protein FB451DRAFT_1190368 [Mycena latifolia]|nr:hypothetical protein FB451DRAFT_1190368 [Mycena latifolia]
MYHTYCKACMSHQLDSIGATMTGVVEGSQAFNLILKTLEEFLLQAVAEAAEDALALNKAFRILEPQFKALRADTELPQGCLAGDSRGHRASSSPGVASSGQPPCVASHSYTYLATPRAERWGWRGCVVGLPAVRLGCGYVTLASHGVQQLAEPAAINPLNAVNILRSDFGTIPSCAWKCLASLSSRQKVSGWVTI